jgi:hypothetical protein
MTSLSKDASVTALAVLMVVPFVVGTVRAVGCARR